MRDRTVAAPPTPPPPHTGFQSICFQFIPWVKRLLRNLCLDAFLQPAPRSSFIYLMASTANPTSVVAFWKPPETSLSGKQHLQSDRCFQTGCCGLAERSPQASSEQGSEPAAGGAGAGRQRPPAFPVTPSMSTDFRPQAEWPSLSRAVPSRLCLQTCLAKCIQEQTHAVRLGMFENYLC